MLALKSLRYYHYDIECKVHLRGSLLKFLRDVLHFESLCEALSVLQDMLQRRVQSNSATVPAAISACYRAVQWHAALWTLLGTSGALIPAPTPHLLTKREDTFG
eukprot:4329650-Amphidinium_carterae.1